MTIIQCRMCRKPFHSIGSKICPECLKQIDKDFMVVRDYIYDNRNSSIEKTSKETGVAKSVILYLLKEGRLTLDNPDSEGLLKCDICRKPIDTGRMCRDCKDSLSSSMNKNIESNKPAEPVKKDVRAGKYQAKMHTEDMRKRM